MLFQTISKVLADIGGELNNKLGIGKITQKINNLLLGGIDYRGISKTLPQTNIIDLIQNQRNKDTAEVMMETVKKEHLDPFNITTKYLNPFSPIFKEQPFFYQQLERIQRRFPQFNLDELLEMLEQIDLDHDPQETARWLLLEFPLLETKEEALQLMDFARILRIEDQKFQQ